jgi:DNA (cytosine-5)-methyltransferase 1
LYIDTIVVENVKEFTTWGPIGANGRPLKSQQGATFHAFLTALRSLGYHAEWRILNAADFGDPTTRERFFLVAHRGRRKVQWPTPTHARTADRQGDLFGELQPWTPARDIIDFSVPSESIFNRKRPLAPATLRRIAAGLRQFAGNKAEPFLVILRNHADARPLSDPLPTLTAGGQHLALCEPFVMPLNHGSKDTRAYPTSRPMPTLTSTDAWTLVEPFLVEYRGNHAGKDDAARRVKRLDSPLPTQDTSNRFGLVEPFLVEYYGTGDARPVSVPIGTLTTRDRYALVEPDHATLDIRFRMLQPHELAKAMSFPTGYKFSGTRGEQVKQIGNAVAVGVATALCSHVLAPQARPLAA